MSKLEEEIEKAQKLVRTDSLQMSIGELSTMYEQNELVINPEFQRLFRWELEQKARLIESILLGIPVPSIFVFETDDGTWELIDGLQRLSSVFEFMGILRDPDTKKVLVPSALIGTKYLKSLNNTVWQKTKLISDPEIKSQSELEKKYQLAIRRARLNVQILKRPSDVQTKYELFQRLNAGGTLANPQELRNSIIITIDPSFSTFMRKLCDLPAFSKIIDLNDEAKEKQRHMEYVSRFLAYTYVDYGGDLDIEEFVDEALMNLAKNGDRVQIESDFNSTFNLLQSACGDGALRRFDGNRYSGRVGYTAFELVSVGIARNISAIVKKKDPVAYIRDRVQKLWLDGHPDQLVYGGMRGTTRISRTIPFGNEWFSK